MPQKNELSFLTVSINPISISSYLYYPHAGGVSQCKLHLDHFPDDFDRGLGGVVKLGLVPRLVDWGTKSRHCPMRKALDGGVILANHDHSHLAVLPPLPGGGR